MKRKNSHNSDTKATKKSKDTNGSSHSKSYQTSTKLNCLSPDDLVGSFIGDVSVKAFLEEFWEKKPLHVQRKDESFYGNFFTLETLYKVIEDEEICYERDINVCRYVDGNKETLNSEGEATVEDVKTLFDSEGATIQFHQPQRFSKELWFLMEKMEKFFGNLVGANVYLTPSKSKGLAPHYDDVEVFILQLEGSKRWRLYKPPVELPRSYSEDLCEDEIGEPTHDITMKPGDFLYFPRGTIHHAEALDDHSTHITISTYQHNSWGDFLAAAMSTAVETAMETNVDFRRGLPINYRSFLGTCMKEDRMNEIIAAKDETATTDKKTKIKETDERVLKFKANLKQLIEQLIDHVDPHFCADLLSEDFIASRLPPMPDNDAEDVEESPTLKSEIQLRHPDHIRLVVCDNEDGSSDEEEDDEEASDEEMEDDAAPDTKKSPKKPSPAKDGKNGKRTSKRSRSNSADKKEKTPVKKAEGDQDADDEDEDDDDFCIDGPFLKLAHSINNEQEEHMIGEEKEPVGIKFPLHFGKALYLLLDKHDGFTVVNDLPLTEEDKLHLATSLWSEGLVDVKCPKEE